MSEGNTYAGWIEALTIFSKYEPDKIYPVQPAHDVVYSGPDPTVVSDEDRQRLEALGWRPSEEPYECFYKFT